MTPDHIGTLGPYETIALCCLFVALAAVIRTLTRECANTDRHQADMDDREAERRHDEETQLRQHTHAVMMLELTQSHSTDKDAS